MNLRSFDQNSTILVLLAAGMLGCTGTNPLRATRDRFLLNEPAPVKRAVDPSIESGPSPVELKADLLPLVGGDRRLNEDRALTLPEALEISMRNSDVVRVSDGIGAVPSPNTAYDPAIAAARMQAALAAFDTTYAANFMSQRINQPPDAFFGPGLIQPVRRDEMYFTTGFTKPLVTGGEARLTYNPSPTYLFLPLGSNGLMNPEFVGNLEFGFRQPLLKGAGTEVTRAPVRIAQFRTEQSAWDFKRTVMENLRGVTEAYYELEAARIAVKAIDDVLPLLTEIVHLQEANFKANWVIQAEVAKAHAQLHLYRQQRAQLQSTVVERELRLRSLLRLPPADGLNMVPATAPCRAPLAFDPADALASAYANHPDLLRQQINVRIREVEWRVTQNGLLPQFDFQALYRMNGVGQNVGDMLQQLSTATYGDWMLGGSFSMPLGRRQAHAIARAAELQLAKERALMQQAALSAAHRIGDAARQIHFTFEQYREAESRLLAADDWLKGSRLRYQNPLPGAEGQNWLLISLNDYLAAVRFRTDAATEAAALLARYNGQLIRLEEAKGTLLAYFDITLVDDPCGLIRVAPATHVEHASHITPAPSPTDKMDMRLPERRIWPLPQREPRGQDAEPGGNSRPEPELSDPQQRVRPFPALPPDIREQPAESLPSPFGPASRPGPREARAPTERMNRPTPVRLPEIPADKRYSLPSEVGPQRTWAPQMPPIFYVP